MGITFAFSRLSGDILGETNAFKSEVVGMIWAAVAALQMRVAGKVTFRCDNLAALGIAEGTCRAGEVPIVQPLRCMHLCVSAEAQVRPKYEHVKGHEGDPANELADALADAACKNCNESGPSASA